MLNINQGFGYRRGQLGVFRIYDRDNLYTRPLRPSHQNIDKYNTAHTENQGECKCRRVAVDSLVFYE